MPYQIRLNSVDVTAPDTDGARLFTIGRNQVIAFEGCQQSAVDWLRSYPIGSSVEARELVDGKSIWIRSCMNKPALWAAIADRAAPHA